METNHTHSPTETDNSTTENRFLGPGVDSRSEDSSFYSLQHSFAGWDGTVLLSPKPCSDPASSDCKSCSSSSENFELNTSLYPERSQQLLNEPGVYSGGEDDDGDEDIDSSEGDGTDDPVRFKRDSSFHQQNLAKAISSKYRFGSSVHAITKHRVMASKMQMKASKLAPGVLVWALLPSVHRLPWWPGIIVSSRPSKRRSICGKEMCYYRIMLIYPPSRLEDVDSFFVARKNLRILKTREAFEKFMQSSLLQVSSKPTILFNFIVPTHDEQAWLSARKKIIEMETMPEKSLTARLKYLRLEISGLRKAWDLEDEECKEKPVELKESEPMKLRESEKRFTPLVKRQLETLPKDEFAFKSLLHVFKGNALARYICCVCLKPGRLLPKSKNKREGQEEEEEETEAAEEQENGDDDSDEDDDQIERGKKSKKGHKPKKHAPSSSSSLPANHVKKATRAQRAYARKLAELEATAMQAWPVLVPCAGCCPNYLHLDCATPQQRSRDSDEVRESVEVFCPLCKLGLRQCCLCLEVQPVQNRSRARQDDQVLRRCAASNCRRWFHRTTCLRRQPYELLVRDGCAETFNCPAHTCMACYSETPGIWPHPTSYFVHCFLCPATFHADEWCIPAGSIWLSRYWIVCSRHAMQTHPQNHLKPQIPSSHVRNCKLPEPKIEVNVAIGATLCSSRSEVHPTKLSPSPPPHSSRPNPPEAGQVSSPSPVEPSTARDWSPMDMSSIKEKTSDELSSLLIKQSFLSRIILSQEQRPLVANWFRPTNISWCLICSRAGEIVCCEGCPSSFHLECLHVDDVEDQFFCEDCTNGRVPRYGEIVWVRVPPLGHPEVKSALNNLAPSLRFLQHTFPPEDVHKDLWGVRWWPGEILHHHSLRLGDGPALSDFDQMEQAARLGFFAVRLFGLYSATPFNGIKRRDAATVLASARIRGRRDDRRIFPVCLWTTQARAFYFEEGDAEMEQNSEDGDGAGDGITVPGVADTSQNEVEKDYDDLESSDEESMTEEDPIMTTFLPTKHASSRPPAILASPARGERISSPSSGRRGERKGGENDRKCRRKRLAVQWREAYLRATKMAGEGLAARKATRTENLKNSEDRPDYYEYIKTNRAIGSVRIRRCTDLSEVPQCECSSSDPCGPNSGCINRSLLYECLASVCVHGKACRNQFFTRRQYPKQIAFYTGKERGWGLKTFVAIRKGDFVNEYVGDLIDEAEANRRLTSLHKNNIHNFYMMKMDSQRIIDAGPKGNLSRFMNHSCCPNLFTQKWTVNGDTRIGLFALRDIAPDEELTFNYNFCSLGQEMKVCSCGAETCVGYLGARHDHSSTNNAVSATPASVSTTATTSTTTTGDTTRSIPGRSVINQKQKGPISKKKLSPSPSVDVTTNGRHETKAASSFPSSPSKTAVRKAKSKPKCYRCNKIVPNPQVVQSSPSHSTTTSGDVSGRNKFKRGRGAQRASTNVSPPAPMPTALNNIGNAGIICPRPDCRKVYHVSCLSLKTLPNGRWVCPWHHCDACGRPSTVFCQRCTTSFCPSHVEGSVAVLPPLNSGGYAQIVCLSHTELIASYNERNAFSTASDSDDEEDEEGDEDDEEEDEEEGADGEHNDDGDNDDDDNNNENGDGNAEKNEITKDAVCRHHLPLSNLDGEDNAKEGNANRLSHELHVGDDEKAASEIPIASEAPKGRRKLSDDDLSPPAPRKSSKRRRVDRLSANSDESSHSLV